MTYGTILAELDVRPELAADDAPNTAMGDTEFGSECLEVPVVARASSTMTRSDNSSASNLQHIGICQLRRAAVLAVMHFQFITSTAFCVSVGAVLCCGSNEQMPWIHARRVITAMKNMQAVLDRTIHQLPDKAVHIQIADSPIAGRSPSSRPFNARVINHSSYEYNR